MPQIRSGAALFVLLLSWAAAAFAVDPQPLDVPAGPLTAALESLAKQVQVELIYEPEQLEGYTTAGLKGTYAVDVAIRLLLKGTPLELHRDASGAMVISLHSSSDNGSATQGSNVPVSAVSQDPPNADVLQEIVVTAYRRAESISQVGGAVSAISGDELLERSANSLQDYVAFIPGVSLASQGAAGFGTVAIRGIAPQGIGASTGTYIDEIPVGASGAATRSSLFTADLDPQDLQRVEVLKGPQGTLYGAESMGGLIKYVTREPNLTNTEITVSEDFNTVEHGDDGVKVRGSFSAPLIDGVLGIRASAYYRHDPGFITDIGVQGSGVGRDNDDGGRLSLLYKPSNDLSVQLTAMAQESRQIGLSVVDTSTTDFTPLYGQYAQLRYEREGFEENTRLYSAEVHYNLGLFDLLSATSYSQLYPKSQSDDTLSFQIYGLGPVTPANPAQDVSNDYTNKLTQEFRLTSGRIGIAELIVGAFYQHERDHFSFVDTLTNTPDVNFSTRASDSTLSEYAGFFDTTLFLSSKFDVTLGYRYSRIDQEGHEYNTGSLNNPDDPDAVSNSYSAVSEGSSTYLAAGRYHVNDALLLYVRAASGYRPGGSRTVPPGAPAGFPDFYTSDKLWSYEAGEKFKGLDGRLTLDADAFWINWSNIQALQLVPGTPFAVNGNAGTAISRGVELQGAYIPIRGLTVGTNGAYTDAHFTDTVPLVANDGNSLSFVPRFSGSAYTEYMRAIGHGWNAVMEGDYQYEGFRVDTYRTPLPGFGVWNARVGVRDPHWEVNFYVRNLTDKYARAGSNSSGSFPLPDYFVIETPRTYGLSFIQKF
jgi:iron complex outermembrane recepter protein